MKSLLLIYFIFLFFNLFAQEDDYHRNLRTLLQTKYGLTGGTWIFTASEVTNATNTTGGGGTRAVVNITDQSFTKATQLAVTTIPANGWNAGMEINISAAVANGDKLLVVFWARTISGPNNIGMGNFEFMMNLSPYTKYMTFEQRIGKEWKQYILPIQMTADLAAGKAKFGVELGVAVQTIQIGGVTAINYKQTYSFEKLPVQSNDEYAGMESGAAWRTAADVRIEQYRKANLEIVVLDENEQPITDAKVKIEMLQHEYAFGTAIDERKIAGNKNQNNTYQDKLFNLDGKGHGFSEVVYENGHKWPVWEGTWNLTKTQSAATVKWLTDRCIRVRGHNLVWPGWSNSPTDLPNLSVEDLKKRINSHIEEMLTYPQMELIKDWDIINEFTGNVDIANKLKGTQGYTTGREIYVEIANKVKEIAPDVKQYVNEAHYTSFYSKNDIFKSYVKEMVDGGVKDLHVGFQAHFRYMIPPEEWYGILEEYHQLTGGLVKITEYDNKTFAPDSLETQYFKDLLTITFSHPYSDGFLMWGFWDGAHYSGRAPLFDKNWNLKPEGEPFIDLVFNKWWTPISSQTSDTSGVVSIRGFKGSYKVTITKGDEQFVDTVSLKSDVKLKYTQPFSHTTGLNQLKTGSIKIYPNPADQHFTIERNSDSNYIMNMRNLNGQLIKTVSAEGTNFQVETGSLASGIYFIEMQDGINTQRRKIVIR
jgi:endo-1,4-beta-xylanase